MIDEMALVMVGSAIAGAIAFWAAVYGWGKWLHRPRPSEDAAIDGDARMLRTEQAVHAIAHEVERLGEAQRAGSQMLAESRAERERALRLSPIAPLPSITPH